MRLLRRPATVLLIVGVLLLGALAAEATAPARQQGGPPLSSTDEGPTGALALATWLERMGYPVVRHRGGGLDINDRRIWFVLEPLRPLDEAEAQALLAGVVSGGTLIYVPSRFDLRRLPLRGEQRVDHLGAALEISVRPGAFIEEGAGWEAFFTQPRGARFFLESWRALDWSDHSWVPLITGPEGSHLAATRALGSGRVYVAASDGLFSNESIGKLDNRTFMLNLLARHGATTSAVFDEVHHTLVVRPQLLDLARTSPWGWAAGYAGALTFLFLLWGGRRFGPPVVPSRVPARSAGEYVTAFAGLLERARASSWAQQQFAQLFRRRLAREIRVSVELPLDRLAALYAERRGLEPETLAASLAAIEGQPLGERALLARVRELEVQIPAGKGTRQ